MRAGRRKELNYHDISLLELRLESRPLGFSLKREHVLAAIEESLHGDKEHGPLSGYGSCPYQVSGLGQVS